MSATLASSGAQDFSVKVKSLTVIHPPCSSSTWPDPIRHRASMETSSFEVADGVKCTLIPGSKGPNPAGALPMLYRYQVDPERSAGGSSVDRALVAAAVAGVESASPVVTVFVPSCGRGIDADEFVSGTRSAVAAGEPLTIPELPHDASAVTATPTLHAVVKPPPFDTRPDYPVGSSVQARTAIRNAPADQQVRRSVASDERQFGASWRRSS